MAESEHGARTCRKPHYSLKGIETSWDPAEENYLESRKPHYSLKGIET